MPNKKEKICRVCGEKFIATNGRQNDCLRPIVKTCAICGNTFEGKCSLNNTRSTCSSSCRKKFARMQLEKAFQSQTRICTLCGLEFNPKTNTQTMCDREHYRECVVCGKQFAIDFTKSQNTAEIRKTCSNDCLHKLMKETNPFAKEEFRQKAKQTMLQRYGVEYPSQDPQLLAKQKQTTKERYGVEFYPQSKEYISKAEETNKIRYGHAWPMQSNEVKSKTVQTNLSRYGMSNVMQNKDIASKFSNDYALKTGYEWPLANPDIQDKIKQANLDKYGTECYAQTDQFREFIAVNNPMKNPDTVAKAEETNLAKYGQRNYMMTEEGKEKVSKSMIEIYGKRTFSQLAEWKLKTMKECTNIEEWMKFTEDPVGYIQDHYSGKPKYRQLAADLGVTPSCVTDLITRNKLTSLISYSQSYMEDEVREFLDELGIQYESHNRKLIAPYELDIYIPKYALAIECNPTATHNSSISFKNLDTISILPADYHKRKTEMCESVGVELFHIFGFDWEHNRSIILSMLRNRLKASNTKIHARKCKVVEVSGKESALFLKNNHRQGNVNSPIRIGLQHDGELVALMTFGKMRSSIGTGKEDLSNCYELVRFCSAVNTTVVGGASKLFNSFVDKYHPQKVRSFSDKAHTSGKLYSVLGFNEIRKSDPGYVWVDTTTDIAYHRINAQKQNIKKFLNDDLIDLNKTEQEIMIEHGYVQVFDSGTITWEWVAE